MQERNKPKGTKAIRTAETILTPLMCATGINLEPGEYITFLIDLLNKTTTRLSHSSKEKLKKRQEFTLITILNKLRGINRDILTQLDKEVKDKEVRPESAVSDPLKDEKNLDREMALILEAIIMGQCRIQYRLAEARLKTALSRSSFISDGPFSRLQDQDKVILEVQRATLDVFTAPSSDKHWFAFFKLLEQYGPPGILDKAFSKELESEIEGVVDQLITNIMRGDIKLYFQQLIIEKENLYFISPHELIKKMEKANKLYTNRDSRRKNRATIDRLRSKATKFPFWHRPGRLSPEDQLIVQRFRNYARKTPGT